MIYSVKNSFGSLSVNSKGAELCSYKDSEGKERIWQGDPECWPGHSPILFPIVGAIQDNMTIVNGKQYHINKHGFAARKEFTLKEQTESSITLSLREDSESLEIYPFSFELSAKFVLNENGYSCTLSVANLSEAEMPFQIGGHPGFICPMDETSVFEDYMLEFEKEENGEIAECPDGIIVKGVKTFPLKDGRRYSLNYADFDANDALIFTSLASRNVKLLNSRTLKGIDFTFSDFELLGVWTSSIKHSKYICLEPWNGMNAFKGETSEFCKRPHTTVLKPGDKKDMTFSMKLIK